MTFRRTHSKNVISNYIRINGIPKCLRNLATRVSKPLNVNVSSLCRMF